MEHAVVHLGAGTPIDKEDTAGIVPECTVNHGHPSLCQYHHATIDTGVVLEEAVGELTSSVIYLNGAVRSAYVVPKNAISEKPLGRTFDGYGRTIGGITALKDYVFKSYPG